MILYYMHVLITAPVSEEANHILRSLGLPVPGSHQDNEG